MIRLRSPHTVNVYGAITSRKDCLVLVMELLPGGDLLSLLKASVEPLEESRGRQIIGDICAGMSFLHHKETIHGDLKSPNVLFDGTGRAKVKPHLQYFRNQCKTPQRGTEWAVTSPPTGMDSDGEPSRLGIVVVTRAKYLSLIHI